MNLYPEPVDTKDGKDVAALYLTPGLALLAATTGNGTGRPGGMHVTAGTLFAVIGSTILMSQPTGGFVVIGTMKINNGPVVIIDNGTQTAFFDGAGTALLAPLGIPLVSGSLGVGGSEYAVGDEIVLLQTGGFQIAPVIVTVTGVNVGVVTTFSIDNGGSFSAKPTSFSQNTTTGSGSGFTLVAPVYSTALPSLYEIDLPFTGGISSGTYQDGFGLISQAGTNNLYQSNVLDLSTWPALAFSEADAQPDPIVALRTLLEEIWIVKTYDTEIWVDAGLENFAFQRLQGVYVQEGCVAPSSVARAGRVLLFLSQDNQGQGVVLMMEGYSAKRVSTFAVEWEISQYPTMTDAVGYAYQQSGHMFYVLSFPSANKTWAFDITTGLWHKRGIWNSTSGTFSRHPGNAHVLWNGVDVINDYNSANLYALSLTALTDNGSPRKWVRSWRATKQPSMEPRRFDALQIDMETGAATTPIGTNPQLELRWSDDGGHNWSRPMIQAAGATGETALRVKFNRLGSTRRNSGLDRIFELSSTDQFAPALIGAELWP